jgi:3-oxoacyl-(acyl-carrier-protein) synthase
MHSPTAKTTDAYSFYNEDVAIIGIDCLLPGVTGAEEMWQDLQYGRDHLRTFPTVRQAFAQRYTRWLGKPDAELRRGNYLDSVSGFDYRFFRIPPKEAALMSPNQRLLLQTVYRAIQDAGISEERIKGSDTGIFIGYIGDYDGSLYSRIVSDTQTETSPTGSLASMNAGRIAYLYDLHGPAVMTDTACSSSLVALYQAYHAIRCGECRMAVVAAARTTLLPDSAHSIGIESSDGATRPFDQDADGTGIGEGAAAVMLKSLHEAVRDGDRIYAVIKGGAVNQDGTGIGMTAPNVNAQIEVLRAAWRNAGIQPEELSYIEAHGTGTKLGDPIELDGLQKALRCYTEETDFCTVGSSKSNYGHLYDCAGLIGVIKTALMLRHRMIAPTVHFHTINPKFTLEGSPLRIASELTAWEPRGGKRLAGVSAFGFSGTNCHIVLGEAPELPDEREMLPDGTVLLFTASARSETSLRRLLDSYRILTYRITDLDLRALCMSCQLDRTHEPIRIAIPVQSVDELREKLSLLCNLHIAQEDVSPYEGIYFGTAQDETPVQPSTNPETLAQQYVTYASMDLRVLYYHQKKYRMPLPLYPFDEKECAVTIPERRCMTDVPADEVSPAPGITLSGDESGSYTDTERYLAQVFADEMGYRELSVNDDIYALGGDSITAYHIVNRINAEQSMEMTMAEILGQRTIRRIASFLDASQSSSTRRYHIPKAPAAERYPLSYAQQRMYFLYLLDPQDTSYNMPFMIRMQGILDVSRFEQACRRLVCLHDVFRTHFAVENGEAVQWVTDEGELEFTQLSCVPDDATIRSLRRPFDLSHDVLIRVFLFQETGSDSSLALIDMNHIAADGSSLGILISELSALYAGETIQKRPTDYIDFAVWQRSMDLECAEAYWLGRMQDLPVYDLPLDHLRSKAQTGSCEISGFTLPQTQYETLHTACQSLGIGTFAFLFAAYQAALSAFTGAEEVVTGTPISGRTAIETQQMVGMFVNVMPLRTLVNQTAPFGTFAQTVHAQILEMLNYQDYPFDLMVDRLHTERIEGRNPIYDTVFAFQNMRIPEFRAEGLKTSLSNADSVSKFDITVEAIEQDDGLAVTFKYNTALFEKQTILQMQEILQEGLCAALTAPDTAVGEMFRSRSDALESSSFDEMDFDF